MLDQMAENMALLEAGKKISSSQKPKMYLRMARLLAGTDDSVFIDTVDDLLAKGATGDQIKNKLRNISESVIPKGRKRLQSDRLHHGVPLEVLDPLMKQDPDVMLEFLQRGEADGIFFGDTLSNVDNSFQEQSHTGAKDRATQQFRNYPGELGIEGDRRFSAHPYGTNKGLDPELNRKYKSGSEMYEAMLPTIREAQFELELGIRADQPRRNAANQLLVEEGILYPGEDYFSSDIPDERIKVGREKLATPELGMQVAAAQNNYLMQDPELLRQAGITQADIDDVTARNQLKLVKARGGSIKINSIQRRLARQFADAAGEIPVAGLVAGPAFGLLLGQSAAEAAGDAIPVLSEIESDNTADVNRTGNLFVDRKTNMVMPTPETVDQGKQGLAYKDGNPVAVPYGSVAGEATTSDMFRAFVNQVFEVQKKRGGGIGLERKRLERQEQLRALPATHPARHGFALGGGM